jgi:uncharacterized protein (DUF305 family)
LLAAAVLFGLAGWLYLGGRPPGDGSAEAGFARDMIVHHAQAVEMAGIIQDKAEDERVQTLAKDITLTQQAQIGQMEGWLAVWGLSPTSNGPAMAWMGHSQEGRMPGMATPAELNAMRNAPPEEAEEMFLRLMITHHEAAIPMANAALERSDRPEVERLAGAIAASQQGEIQVMQDLLRDKGAAPAAPVAAPGGGDHTGHDPAGHQH